LQFYFKGKFNFVFYSRTSSDMSRIELILRHPIHVVGERTTDQPFERHGTSIRKHPLSIETMLLGA